MWLSLYLSYLEFAELLGSLSLSIAAAVNKLRTVWPLFLLLLFFFFFCLILCFSLFDNVTVTVQENHLIFLDEHISI